jgi:hypothetical protein
MPIQRTVILTVRPEQATTHDQVGPLFRRSHSQLNDMIRYPCSSRFK